mmetsp:Transcript_13542/g.40932  ORF Transcript_13542/g.40932 Transcript_13542/m.40932 type:complete len:210 (-) Transcript_13542:1536-2165(-)
MRSARFLRSAGERPGKASPGPPTVRGTLMIFFRSFCTTFVTVAAAVTLPAAVALSPLVAFSLAVALVSAVFEPLVLASVEALVSFPVVVLPPSVALAGTVTVTFTNSMRSRTASARSRLTMPLLSTVRWVLILPASPCFLMTSSMPVMVNAPSDCVASEGVAPGFGGPSNSCKLMGSAETLGRWTTRRTGSRFRKPASCLGSYVVPSSF